MAVLLRAMITDNIDYVTVNGHLCFGRAASRINTMMIKRRLRKRVMGAFYVQVVANLAFSTATEAFLLVLLLLVLLEKSSNSLIPY